MGRVGPQPADYIIFQKGKPSILLDPKELKKGQRVNIKSRFTQMGQMSRFSLTGVKSYFLIHQTVDDLYYVVNREYVESLIKDDIKSVLLTDLPVIRTLKRAINIILED